MRIFCPFFMLALGRTILDQTQQLFLLQKAVNRGLNKPYCSTCCNTEIKSSTCPNVSTCFDYQQFQFIHWTNGGITDVTGSFNDSDSCVVLHFISIKENTQLTSRCVLRLLPILLPSPSCWRKVVLCHGRAEWAIGAGVS